MKKYIFIVVSFLLFCNSFAQNYYAVLISGWDVNERSLPSGEDAFWNDTYMTWEILYNDGNGFDDENILILYGNGQDIRLRPYNLRYIPPWRITDFSATRQNVVNVLIFKRTPLPFS